MAGLTPTPERPLLTDFATIFAHSWYRDFPLQFSYRESAQRADWTTHIGIAVRSTADLMGLFTRFESGGRTDAVLRDNQGKAIAALEWEWSAVHMGHEVVTEFEKLKECCAKPIFEGMHFACLIGYARIGNSVKSVKDYSQLSAAVLDDYTKRWARNLPPLLLVLIHFERKGKGKGRKFSTMTIDELREGSRKRLREQPAYPWEVIGSRWAQGTKSP